ncbi:hypothetical protein J3R82DRAFT_5487 [Butyriboletus roseoflavus]|nr:hypothetical protein J3R82DRAFT_5487 [Butyriboletus roseoflavus]
MALLSVLSISSHSSRIKVSCPPSSRVRTESRLMSLQFIVIPKHFVPPMLANAVLGTVLWTTYTECSSYLQSCLGVHSMFTAALSGAAAGGMQAIVAAPVDNVRLVIEGGTREGWSHAWKEVFLGTQPIHTTSRSDQIRDIRQVRLWMKDVGEMAGRGWAGWGWGCGKDICGFAAFFTVFEITRKVAHKVKLATHHVLRRLQSGNEASHSSHLPRFTNAFTLVCGGMMAGLTYETFCRPWDVARRALALERARVPHLSSRRSSLSVLRQKLQEDGITSFFREHSAGLHSELRSNAHRRISSAARTLARVGPWGVGFLVWESLGPGLDWR